MDSDAYFHDEPQPTEPAREIPAPERKLYWPCEKGDHHDCSGAIFQLSVCSCYCHQIRDAEPQWLDDDVKTFAEAQVGDHAYTWEPKGSHDFGEYRFETAGDPREFYDGCGRIVRKRWELIEIVELDADDE